MTAGGLRTPQKAIPSREAEIKFYQECMISDILSLIDFLDNHYDTANVKKALFSADGTRISGDSALEVVKIPAGYNEGIWFYKVKEIENYVFVYMPVNPSLYFDYGMPQGSTNQDSKIFRFVSNPMSMFASGGVTNVTTEFIVVGYKPVDLLSKTK